MTPLESGDGMHCRRPEVGDALGITIVACWGSGGEEAAEKERCPGKWEEAEPRDLPVEPTDWQVSSTQPSPEEALGPCLLSDFERNLTVTKKQMSDPRVCDSQ